MAVTNSPTGIELGCAGSIRYPTSELMTLLLNRRMQAAIEANPDGPRSALHVMCTTISPIVTLVGAASLTRGKNWRRWRRCKRVAAVLSICATSGRYQLRPAAFRASLEKAVQQASNRPNKALADACMVLCATGPFFKRQRKN